MLDYWYLWFEILLLHFEHDAEKFGLSISLEVPIQGINLILHGHPLSIVFSLSQPLQMFRIAKGRMVWMNAVRMDLIRHGRKQ